MAYIYKIVNKINGKIYIGKTLKTIQERFNEHCNDYKKDRNEKRPLYSAMNKYGIENFYIEEVEKCLDSEIDNREKYWIEYYNSFKNGYNATLGGDGKAYIDRELVIKTYNELKNQTKTAKILNICVDSVHDILVQNNIQIKRAGDMSKDLNSKQVAMIDKKTLQVLKIFNSVREAEKFLGISYRTHIPEVCNGKRKTCQGYIWKYIENM